MVSPEQCATAPKAALKAVEAPARPQGSARLVLLAVLALAAATGAMFGVVVFGNEFTKDVHPKGDTYSNSITLVDSSDRAIATADVESFVSLLDLPLLGTAELNKIDGITFGTHNGLEHRKVTGYTVTMESGLAGDSVVSTPRLSLRSEPGVTIEVSIRDSRAWLLDVNDGRTTTTAIDATPSRRLSEASGSCLANGACLYSRDELLRIDSETRRLSEGSFFARADVAAYQVDLNGEDTAQYAASAETVTYFEGSTAIDAHEVLLRMQTSVAHSQIYVLNRTDGSAKLMTRNGTFNFENDELVGCSKKVQTEALGSMSIEDLQLAQPFDAVKIEYDGSRDDFIPHGLLTVEDCTAMNTAKGNLSSPDAQLALFGSSFQYPQGAVNGNAVRKLVRSTVRPQSRAEVEADTIAEMRDLMMNPNNERNRQLRSLREQLAEKHSVEELEEMYDELERRRLAITWKGAEDYTSTSSTNTTKADMLAAVTFTVYEDTYATDSSYTRGTHNQRLGDTGYYTYISHFDLWICTRLADPSFISKTNYYADAEGGLQALLGVGSKSDISSGDYLAASFALDIAGGKGISSSFAFWAGFSRLSGVFEPEGLAELIDDYTDSSLSKTYVASRKLADSDSEVRARALQTTTDFFEIDIYLGTMSEKIEQQLENDLSKAFYHAMYPGACAGGFTAGEDTFYLLGELADMNAGMNFDDAYNFCDKMMTEIEGLSDSDAFFEGSDNMWYNSRRRLAPTSKAQFAGISSLLLGYCETLTDNKGAGATTAHGALELKHAHAWGSYLKKSTPESGGDDMEEYVVAFQGTKANDMSMIQFSTKAEPMAAYWDGKVHIVAEGHYMYMSSLLDCFDWFMDDTGTVPAFVTGHSLGGAAATLYHKGKSVWATYSAANVNTFYPRLVTFGATATSYAGTPVVSGGTTAIRCDDSAIGMYVGTDAVCSGGDVTPAGFADWANGGMSAFCYSAAPQSVRFAHKFDPIPSIMFTGVMYQHQVENAILLWDVYDGSCASNYDASDCAISAKSLDSGEDYKMLGLKGTNPEKIKEWVCSKTKATPISYATTCDQELTSYMTLLNPFPCGMVLAKTYSLSFTASQLASGTVDQADTEGDFKECIEDSGGVRRKLAGCIAGYKWLTGKATDSTIWYDGVEYDVLTYYDKYFKLIDDYDTCVSDWVTSIYAHLGAGIAENPDSYGLMFTFTWIHSTYSMYPLCIEIDTSGKVESFIPDALETAVEADMADKVTDFGCSASEEQACYNFCKMDGYMYSSECYTDCLNNDCCPISVKEINDAYSVSSTDMALYGNMGSCDLTENLVDMEYEAGGKFATGVPTAAAVPS
jgi:hypothetical protein